MYNSPQTKSPRKGKRSLVKRPTHQSQMSEAFIVSVFLALGGGFQDAYTYMVRDHVFANAQTGNVVLMSTHLFGGEWAAALRYLLPLLAFVAGVLVAEQEIGRASCRERV